LSRQRCDQTYSPLRLEIIARFVKLRDDLFESS
jgi:hypothetical protein